MIYRAMFWHLHHGRVVISTILSSRTPFCNRTVWYRHKTMLHIFESFGARVTRRDGGWLIIKFSSCDRSPSWWNTERDGICTNRLPIVTTVIRGERAERRILVSGVIAINFSHLENGFPRNQISFTQPRETHRTKIKLKDFPIYLSFQLNYETSWYLEEQARQPVKLWWIFYDKIQFLSVCKHLSVREMAGIMSTVLTSIHSHTAQWMWKSGGKYFDWARGTIN